MRGDRGWGLLKGFLGARSGAPESWVGVVHFDSTKRYVAGMVVQLKPAEVVGVRVEEVSVVKASEGTSARSQS